MSRVYWHTRDHGTAELRGSERAYASELALAIGMGIAWPRSRARERMASALVDPPDYLVAPADDRQWGRFAETWLRTDGVLSIYGEAMPFGTLALNTLITMNRPLRLLAWMDGLCESHGYFEPDAQPALIETISEGLASKSFRWDQGWSEVLKLLMDLDGAGPIVWSYSVCESFPERWQLRPPRDPSESDEDYEERVDRHIYDEISPEETWDRCIEILRAAEWPVALHPDIEQRFLNGKTLFDFVDSRDRELAQT